MATLNGIIETATGDLLRWGYSTFTPGTGESAAPTPLPANPKRKFQSGETQMHQWNGAAYILVAQPPKPAPDATFGKVTAEKDVLISNDQNGVCLTSGDGSIWRQTIDDSGATTWTKQ